MIYRHGDLLLYPTKKAGKQIYKGEKYVLAYGEITGHKHLLTAEPQTEFEVYQDEQGNTILNLKGKGQLTHEEHKKIEILPDTYKVIHEQEYDYAEQEINLVLD